jgi:hypothetical protein
MTVTAAVRATGDCRGSEDDCSKRQNAYEISDHVMMHPSRVLATLSMILNSICRNTTIDPVTFR